MDDAVGCILAGAVVGPMGVGIVGAVAWFGRLWGSRVSGWRAGAQQATKGYVVDNAKGVHVGQGKNERGRAPLPLLKIRVGRQLGSLVAGELLLLERDDVGLALAGGGGGGVFSGAPVTGAVALGF